MGQSQSSSNNNQQFITKKFKDRLRRGISPLSHGSLPQILVDGQPLEEWHTATQLWELWTALATSPKNNKYNVQLLVGTKHNNIINMQVTKVEKFDNSNIIVEVKLENMIQQEIEGQFTLPIDGPRLFVTYIIL